MQELSIARTRPAADARRAQMRALSGLAVLHQASLQHHRKMLRGADGPPHGAAVLAAGADGDSAPPDAEKLQRHLQRLAGVKQD